MYVSNFSNTPPAPSAIHVDMSIGLVNNPGLPQTGGLYEGLVLPGGTILFVMPGGLVVDARAGQRGLSVDGWRAHGEYVSFIFALGRARWTTASSPPTSSSGSPRRASRSPGRRPRR
jgi:hypothetical protein